ncbi:Short chain dehydrogenase [Thermobacillus xylanilyticus]|jgi:hypothetical protein|uniref:Short chain dehydrogenase n=1 Tax=Thermobacillus xylanilyticus TaxID=76633 RepID=A0ABM8V420_THEXY|nr:short-chain dehydrogenase [Thermobacillus xylanilyticus]CAG5086136.1 Short chain dehydrogenase [Thermobacillus xylanilyticus]
MRHALVIGGSGMLAGASLWLARQGREVTVIGRNPQKLKLLSDQHPNLHGVSADYSRAAEFAETLNDMMRKWGPADLVVAWIHHDEERVIGQTAEAIRLAGGADFGWELYHVLGSSSNLDEMLRKIAVPPECACHQVQLGFVIEGGRSRWLTHDEISNGVIECIQNNRRRHVVGTLEPWEKRPGY